MSTVVPTRPETQQTEAPADLAALDAALTGRVLASDNADFARMSTPWNLAATWAPVAVVEAGDAADVCAAVRYAAQHGLDVDVRCTGHGAADVDRATLLVHTGRLDELTIDPHTGTARVGAGVRWDALLAAAAPHGLAAPAGSAPRVGVVGYLTGGGVGPVARSLGLGSDAVTAIDVVTGDGVLRRATASENPALFWGLRGGKGALGIITAVELDLVPCAELYGGCLYFRGEDAASVLNAWATWSRMLPESGTSSVAVLRLPAMPGVPEPLAGQVTVAVRYAWVGDPEEGAAALRPMLESGQMVLGGTGIMPFAAIGAIHADPLDPMPSRDTNLLLSELASGAVDRLVALAGPEAECPQVVVELRHLGGALRSPGAAAPSAYGFRDAAYAVTTIGLAVPPLIDAVAAHAAAVAAALQPWVTPGCLPNWEASNDPATTARRYPADTLARLASLVEAYDPHGVLTAGRAVVAAAHTAV